MFVCLVWGVFVLLFEDIRVFAFHLFSYKLRIVDRLQDVDDRQSARHGAKKNKDTIHHEKAKVYRRGLW